MPDVAYVFPSSIVIEKGESLPECVCTGAKLQWRHVQHTLCSCPGVPGVGVARQALQSALQSAADLAVGDSCRRVWGACGQDAADPAALMPFLLDPAAVCGPQSPLVPVLVRAAADFLRAARIALVVAPLAASCVQGSFPRPRSASARGRCPDG
jgi:hypothetical protein